MKRISGDSPNKASICRRSAYLSIEILEQCYRRLLCLARFEGVEPREK